MGMGPKRRAVAPSTTITFETTPEVVKQLKTLVRAGHYGRDIGEAAERLVCHGLMEIIERGNRECAELGKHQRQNLNHAIKPLNRGGS